MNPRWRPLEPGEPIGVVALSGPVDAAKLEAGLDVLRAWGHPVIEASNLRRVESYLAGSDAQRLAGLEGVLEAGARLVIAARGGYGATRLLPYLPFERMAERGVTLVGFSDLTAILNPLAMLGGTPQIHGPMIAAGLAQPGNAERLRGMLQEHAAGRALFSFGEASVARHGGALGKVVGGNLSLLVSLLGTPWEPDFEGCVLFLEEVGEPLYRLDRMLTHLRGSGRLQQVKALIGGSLHGCRPAGERSKRWPLLLLEAAPEGVPVVTGLPFGHGAKNLAFPIGAVVELDTRRGRLAWR
jgi:muramoyltetrapeptide carboxypeptidase